MKVVIIGNEVSALVASFAVFQREKVGAQQILLAPIIGDQSAVTLFAPPNDVMPAAIPALSQVVRARTVHRRTTGSPDAWPAKVQSALSRIPETFPVADETFVGHTAMDVFHTLVARMGNGMTPWHVGRDPLEELVTNWKPDVIINTAPRGLFCSNDEHVFSRRPVWVSHTIGPSIADNEILLNSEDAPAWYVTSKFDGVQETRWLVKPPFSAVAEDSFPISTNCDCAPAGMVHIGMEAECNPRITLSDVYSSAVAALLREEI